MELAPRAYCHLCDKPVRTCLCARIPRLQNRTPVVVLQHPRERAHPIGTARLVRLGLAASHVEVVWDAGAEETEVPGWVPPGAGVLYPSPDARDLARVPSGERPRALVVVDGTWHTARTLHRDKKWLHGLPHFRLSPEHPSRYRIRREPSHDAVSTLEAIVEALGILEPGLEGTDRLLRAFDAMIDEQLGFMERSAGRPRFLERRPLASRRLPRAVVEDFERLVIVYCESARPDPRGPRELVQCAAVRIATGDRFEHLVRASFGPPGPEHLAHMGLTERDFESAISPAAFREEWHRFAAKDPVVAAWNQGTLDLLAAATGTTPSRAALKGAYRSSHPDHAGSLEEVALREAWTPTPTPFRGRARSRLALALAAAHALHARSR